MEYYLLADFGSTYTKVCLVQKGSGQLLGWAQSPTTVAEGVGLGFERACSGLDFPANPPIGRFGCSSAAGGLRLVAVGLVPQLTAEAARRAALGAGARVLRTYSYQLTPSDLQEMKEDPPDLLLLAGGTDGGNHEVVWANANALAASDLSCPIIYAGNRSAAQGILDLLLLAGKEVQVVENVMPQLGKIHVEPTSQAIRRLFLERIIHAKGLGEIEQLLDGLMMPTPAAVLEAGRLLARTWGDLLVVDLGGATTDVHSLATGQPTKPRVIWQGLPEPYAKRTVEGDLGMRISAPGILEVATPALEHFGPGVDQYLHQLATTPSYLPQTPWEMEVEGELAQQAIRHALARHVGRVEPFYTPTGQGWAQTGKDLTGAYLVIGTGGALIHRFDGLQILQRALGEHDPRLLIPQSPTLVLDSQYRLAAAGLLATWDPETALAMMEAGLFGVNGQSLAQSRWTGQ